MRKKNRQARTSDAEYVRGGKGRRDEVGPTGIYPASSANAPANAELRGQEELGHMSPHGQALQEVPKKEDEIEHHGKAHDRSVRDSEIRRETQTSAAMGRLPGTTVNPADSEE